MHVDTFPCPFCRSAAVTATGGGRSFRHYRCSECHEVWTAQNAVPLSPLGRNHLRSLETPETLRLDPRFWSTNLQRH